MCTKSWLKCKIKSTHNEHIIRRYLIFLIYLSTLHLLGSLDISRSKFFDLFQAKIMVNFRLVFVPPCKSGFEISGIFFSLQKQFLERRKNLTQLLNLQVWHKVKIWVRIMTRLNLSLSLSLSHPPSPSLLFLSLRLPLIFTLPLTRFLALRYTHTHTHTHKGLLHIGHAVNNS